jgi:hypothetical protein
MYLGAIILLMLVLPLISVAAEAPMLPDAGALMGLIGKWFTFWGVGVRLFLAGAMQVFRPQFTAEDIFEIGDPAAQVIVREIGFGNLAMGTLGILSLFFPDFLVPAAIAGGLFFGLAGIGHLARKDRNLKEQIALVSDLGIFLVLAAFVASRLLVIPAQAGIQ